MNTDLTAVDVAATMQCSVKTVLKLANRGRLRGYKLGRAWRFKPHAVESFRQPVVPPAQTATPAQRSQPRRGGTLPGWHDFD